MMTTGMRNLVRALNNSSRYINLFEIKDSCKFFCHAGEFWTSADIVDCIVSYTVTQLMGIMTDENSKDGADMLARLSNHFMHSICPSSNSVKDTDLPHSTCCTHGPDGICHVLITQMACTLQVKTHISAPIGLACMNVQPMASIVWCSS